MVSTTLARRTPSYGAYLSGRRLAHSPGGDTDEIETPQHAPVGAWENNCGLRGLKLLPLLTIFGSASVSENYYTLFDLQIQPLLVEQHTWVGYITSLKGRCLARKIR